MIMVLRNLVLKCLRPCCEVRMISSTKCINQKKNSTFDNVSSNRNKSIFDKLRTRHGRRIIARKLEGLPSESEAPHLKCVFASNLDSYMLLCPLLNWCILPSLALTNYGINVLNAPILNFAYVIIPLWAYGINFCVRTMPLRMYYDEKKDKTFATFTHPFIPFKFTRKEIRHNSLVAKGKAFGGGIKYQNRDNLKIAFATEDFRLPVDFKRLLKS